MLGIGAAYVWLSQISAQNSLLLAASPVKSETIKYQLFGEPSKEYRDMSSQAVDSRASTITLASQSAKHRRLVGQPGYSGILIKCRFSINLVSIYEWLASARQLGGSLLAL
jgi:hypothetical protein